MAYTTHDSRLAESDRHYARWVGRGVPPKVVHALLPMLVGPIHTQRAAERFMAERGAVGNDMSPEGVAAERQLLAQAKALHQSALESGAFAGHGSVFTPPAGRYLPSERATNDELDRQHTQVGYPGSDRNAETLRLSAVEEAMQRKHRDGTVTVDPDSGDVYRTDPHTLSRVKIDHVDLPKRNRPSDLSRFQKGQHDSADLSNEDAEEAWGYPDGIDRPFFLDL